MIYSPIASGNGAHVVHKSIESNLKDYKVVSYNPYWTLVPFVLPCFREHHCDIVHTTPDYASFFRTNNTKTVLTFHNYVLDSFMYQYSTFLQNLHYRTDLKRFTLNAVKSADVITCVSSFTASLVRQHLGYKGRIIVITNGIDSQNFRKKKAMQFDTDHIKVLFCGNLTRRKGAQWLSGIADRLSDNIIILYTAGLRNTKSALIHPKLQCAGTIPYENMPDLYSSVDMLLMPTVREGMSLAVLEAMACELPVIATNCSSMPELIDNGEGGFLCSLGNEAEFAEKINYLARLPTLRKEMGEYNRKKVEKMFTMDRMVREYRNLFEEIMG